MSTQFESGHAKNVANLEDLISYCLAYGTAYNPSANNIKITALQTLLTNAKAAIASTTSTFTAYKNATNAREVAFDGIRRLSTRVVNVLDAGGAAAQTIKDARAIDRKMKGRSATRSTAVPAVSLDPNAPPSPVEEGRHNSTSQQSFDSLMQHMAAMIQLVSTESTYAPNETELKVTGLNTYLAALQAKNTAVINANTAWSNSRIARNAMLYHDATGLVKISTEVKKYVKALFGATSSQYRQLSALKFNKVNT